MSTQLPDSTIWREDWAKRLSSRSKGGTLRMPGSQSKSPSSVKRAKGWRPSALSQRGKDRLGSSDARAVSPAISAAFESVMVRNYVGPPLCCKELGLYKRPVRRRRIEIYDGRSGDFGRRAG